MTKKVATFFYGKIGVTRSVAAPCDTNPSDATALAATPAGTPYAPNLKWNYADESNP